MDPVTSAADAAPFTLGNRPALDGLRGVAILMVLASHIPILELNGGFLGVDLFFVLSGFLITSLLLEEARERGGVSLTAFYARRALRLLPALVAMLAVVVVYTAWLGSPGKAADTRTSAIMTLLYSANWFIAFKAYPCAELTTTWSLSVEEQFYIVWPLLLLAMLRMKLSRRSTGIAVSALILASAALRGWLWWLKSPAPGSFERAFFGSDVHADGLLAGCLAAICFSWGLYPKTPQGLRILNGLALVMVVALGIVTALGWPADPWLYYGGLLVLNAGAAALVACLVISPWRGLRMVFEFPPLVWTGRISYGLYLWHIAVFWILSESRWPKGSWYWEIAVATTFAVSAASFYGLERPLLRLKKRFARVGSGRVPG